jgi:hypothetical protein
MHYSFVCRSHDLLTWGNEILTLVNEIITHGNEILSRENELSKSWERGTYSRE